MSKHHGSKLRALHDLAQSWPGIQDARACVVKIGRESWPAVWYRQEVDTPSGSRSHMAGERTYVREGIYCLGQLPSGYERSRYRDGHALCFPYEGRDWYVGGYIQKIKREFKQHHKLGKNFILSPWDVPGGEAIDHYYTMERGREYKRVPMHVFFVSV